MKFHGTLGIISGTTATISDGKIWVNHSIGRLIEELIARSDDFRLCLPIIQEKISSLNHPLTVDPKRLLHLPPLQTTISAQRYYYQTRAVLENLAEQSDALFIRLPFQLPNQILGLQKPKVLHIVSSPVNVIQASTDYKGPLRLASRGFAKFSEFSMKRASREPFSRVCSNGVEMWSRINPPAGRIVVSSCMYRREMVSKRNFSIPETPRLLFVGYLRPEKGVLDLLKSFEQIRETRSATLTLAGGSDRKTEAGRLIQERIQQSKYSSDINMVGMVNFGDELFSMYRGHDILLQPSLSEGTPRTLIEARSVGLPVIATRVGGIPSSVSHMKDGILVSPNSPGEITERVHQLLDDETLRLEIIENGLRNRDLHSLENFADQLIEEACLALNESRFSPC